MPRRPGRQLALHDSAGRGQPPEGIGDHRDAEAQPRRSVDGVERAVGAGVPRHQVAQRIGHRLGERLRHADRKRHAERVAQPPSVLDGGPALLAGDPDPDRPSGVLQRRQVPRRIRRLDAPFGHGGRRERPEQPEQVGHPLEVAGLAVGREPLQLRLGPER